MLRAAALEGVDEAREEEVRRTVIVPPSTSCPICRFTERFGLASDFRTRPQVNILRSLSPEYTFDASGADCMGREQQVEEIRGRRDVATPAANINKVSEV